MACHLRVDAYHLDADPDPVYHFDADPDPDPISQFDANPDPQHCLKLFQAYSGRIFPSGIVGLTAGADLQIRKPSPTFSDICQVFSVHQHFVNMSTQFFRLLSPSVLIK